MDIHERDIAIANHGASDPRDYFSEVEAADHAQPEPQYLQPEEEPYSSSSLHLSDAPDPSNLDNEAYSPDERAIREHLNEVESSFLPDSAPAKSSSSSRGKDDTYLNLGHASDDDSPPQSVSRPAAGGSNASTEMYKEQAQGSRHPQDEHHTGHNQEGDSDEERHLSKSAASSLPESPSAAAAFRNNMRTHGHSSLRRELSARAIANSIPSRQSSSPGKASILQRSISSNSGSRNVSSITDTLSIPEIQTVAPSPQTSESPLARPNQGHTRQYSHASSTGGYSDLSGGSDATIGADYALQTGSAAPNDSPLSNRYARDLSRLPSFGSVASEMSRDGDRGMPAFNRGLSAISAARGLSRTTRIDEEESRSTSPTTPRVPLSQAPSSVTDTVIAQHIQNIQVPDTVAQDFRQRFRSASPDKRSVSNSTHSRPQSTLTLKEQNSKIDKLTKENFDLKLKIHFLDQALQNRSDEGIKDMINANVSFQTDLAKERRDNQSLRRRIRDLERHLADMEEQLADAREARDEARMSSHQEMEIEISELREQLDHAQIRITKLSAENLAKEMEKRRMGEYMASMQERKGSAVGDEEIDMWRDLLTEEQGRREMAEDEARKLREEMTKLKAERLRKQREEERTRSERSRSVASGLTDERNGAGSSSSVTLIEHLRHENTELRRNLGAQSSMLTSRNKERERLQQEIEDLKMMNRKGGDTRSVGGDSIFERSASRAARAPSRTSNVTGTSRVDEAERDEYERREGLLRDENAQLRLEYQDLEKEAEARLDYITQLEEDLKNAEVDLSAAVEDLRALQRERDEALSILEIREVEIEKLGEDYRRLEEEAVLNIEGLEDNMAHYETNRDKVASELSRRNEDFTALQSELRSVAAKLVHFEGDRDASMKRIEVLEQELDDATQELESFERKLRESEQKNQRLEIQSESLQNEISFLREEQEADKVKIGDLSNALHAAQQAVQDEKEKMQELEASLFEERRQREMIDDQSKQEVQKVISDLNSDNAKSRDDLRKLRRNLSNKENEAETYKTRLEELESNLRRVLGDVAGTRATLLQDVERLQHDLSRTTQDLEAARADVSDKERLIKSRDVLLESSGLEARRLSDLLDKERQGRKHDLHNFDMAQRGSSSHARIIATHEARTTELESALSQAKRRVTQVENTYKDQLAERNALLLSLWNRLSTLCGTDWAQQHGSLNGSVTNIENIGKFWSHFQRNVLAATKHIETLFSGLRTRIRTAEREMGKDVATLNSALESRVKQLERLERAVTEVTQVNAQLRSAIANSSLSASSGRSPSVLSMASKAADGNKLTKVHQEEIKSLRSEIKSLKTELKIHRSYPSSEAAERISAEPSGHTRRSSVLGLVLGDLASRTVSREGTNSASAQEPSGSRLSPANLAHKFLRHNSEGAVRTLSLAAQNRRSMELAAAPPLPTQPQQQQQQQQRASVDLTTSMNTAAESAAANDQRWLHRVRELERRLKAEREARLLDRRGARERLDARSHENEELRAELDRERHRGTSVADLPSSAIGSPDLGSDEGRERWHSFDDGHVVPSGMPGGDGRDMVRNDMLEGRGKEVVVATETPRGSMDQTPRGSVDLPAGSRNPAIQRIGPDGKPRASPRKLRNTSGKRDPARNG